MTHHAFVFTLGVVARALTRRLGGGVAPRVAARPRAG